MRDAKSLLDERERFIGGVIEVHTKIATRSWIVGVNLYKSRLSVRVRGTTQLTGEFGQKPTERKSVTVLKFSPAVKPLGSGDRLQFDLPNHPGHWVILYPNNDSFMRS